jgi:hypothetical protein
MEVRNIHQNLHTFLACQAADLRVVQATSSKNFQSLPPGLTRNLARAGVVPGLLKPWATLRGKNAIAPAVDLKVLPPRDISNSPSMSSENFILAGVDMERDAACWGSDAFEKKVIATCFGAAPFDGDLLANDDEFALLAGLQECGFVVSNIHKVFSAIFVMLSAAW